MVANIIRFRALPDVDDDILIILTQLSRLTRRESLLSRQVHPRGFRKLLHQRDDFMGLRKTGE
jgi:hypothetical protein